MPLLGLPKQRLHPHAPFPHCFRVRWCAVVLSHPLTVLFVEGAIELAACVTVGTLCADGTRLTRGGWRLVDADLGDIVVAPKAEDRPLRAAKEILLRLVSEVPLAEERTALAPVG